MSKNLTLKGAAFGALVALSISAVAPASAAGLADTSFVSLAPSSGTEYNVLATAGAEFSLEANEASSVAGTGRNLKFLVTDSAKAIDVATSSTGLGTDTFAATTSDTYERDTNGLVKIVDNAAAASVFAEGDRVHLVTDIVTATGADIAAGYYTVASAVDATNSYFTFQTDVTGAVNGAAALTQDDDFEFAHAAWATDNSFVVDSGVATSSTDETLVLTVAGTTTRTATVTAWVDANGDGDIDSTEYVSPTRTVKFVKSTEVTATTTLVQPVLGDSALVAKIATTPVLNGDQLGDNGVTAKFTRQGSTSELTPAQTADDGDVSSGTRGASVWNDTDKVWVATAHLVQSASATPWAVLGATADSVVLGTYSAKAYIGSDAISSASTLSVAALVADDVKASVAGSANLQAATNEDETAPTTVYVRKTNGSVVVSAKVYSTTADVAVGAGVDVKATLSSKTGTIKVNGETTSAVVRTDANGSVTFTLTNTSLSASDAVTLTLTAQGVTTSGKQAQFVFDWADAVYSIIDVDDAAGTAEASIVKGGSHTYHFAVVDQFKQAISGDYRLKVTTDTFKVSTSYHALSAGRAAVTIADDEGSNSTGVIGVDADLQVKSAAGAWADTDSNTVGAVDFADADLNVIAAQTDAITLQNDVDATTSEDSDVDASVSDEAVAAVDTRLTQGSALVSTDGTNFSSPADTAADEVVTVSGTVANSITAVGRAGAAVTISGSGFVFSAGDEDSATVFAKDSLTVFASDSGTFRFDVLSNKAVKDAVITVTSNGVSKTIKVTFVGIAAKTMAISAPATALPGAAVSVTASLFDKWGNLSSTTGTITFTTDLGWLTNEGAITVVSGKANTKLILGTSDKGTANITATSSDLNDADGNDTVVKASIQVGAATPAATAAIAGSTGKVYASVSNAAGKTVVIKINGVTKKTFAGTLAKKTVVVYSTAGAKNVSVFVGGSRVATKVVTIK